MTRKNLVRMGALLTVLGFATLFGFQGTRSQCLHRIDRRQVQHQIPLLKNMRDHKP